MGGFFFFKLTALAPAPAQSPWEKTSIFLIDNMYISTFCPASTIKAEKTESP